eukprot:306323-Chlamydomonas_euryale.AAC.2
MSASAGERSSEPTTTAAPPLPPPVSGAPAVSSRNLQRPSSCGVVHAPPPACRRGKAECERFYSEGGESTGTVSSRDLQKPSSCGAVRCRRLHLHHRAGTWACGRVCVERGVWASAFALCAHVTEGYRSVLPTLQRSDPDSGPSFPALPATKRSWLWPLLSRPPCNEAILILVL